MKLKNTYVIGTNIMFYEIEMLSEMVDSIIQAVDGIENPENVNVEMCWNTQQYLENIDHTGSMALYKRYQEQMSRLAAIGIKLHEKVRTDAFRFYNIAQYRRDLNHNWCENVDFVMWGETDSLWPKETFHAIEQISEYARGINVHRYIISFAYRKNWDQSWNYVTHPDFEHVDYVDEHDWIMNNPASSKSYMSLDEMNIINAQATDFDIRELNVPKFDGS